MVGADLPDEIDPAWREMCRWEITAPAPVSLRDRDVSEDGAKVSPAVRDVVKDVKANVFPLHGL